MSNKTKIIRTLLELTVTMQVALEKRNIDVVEQMIKERDEWLKKYSGIEGSTFSKEEALMIEKLLVLDKENNVLLEELVKKSKDKANSTGKEKNDVKKRTSVAKRYLTNASMIGENSKFNKKT